MNIKSVFVGFLGALMITCSHSYAGVVYLSGNSFDDLGGSTIDLSTQLEWLDVTATLGKSYAEVYAETLAEGSLLFGWRFANRDEYNELLGNVMPSDPKWVYYKDEDFYDTLLTPSSYDPALLQFVEIFGDTRRAYSDESGEPYSAPSIVGWLSENGDPFIGAVRKYSYAGWAIPYNRSGWLSADLSFPGTGSFLVRSVPEPSSVILVMLGLFGLGLARYRRTL